MNNCKIEKTFKHKYRKHEPLHNRKILPSELCFVLQCLRKQRVPTTVPPPVMLPLICSYN